LRPRWSYCVVHALTPGHNKTLLAIYVTGNRTDLRLALCSAFLRSLIHISLSVALVLIAQQVIDPLSALHPLRQSDIFPEKL
jgi:ABC-type nickel/cobalt efflux system permease component RcnA